MRHIGWLIIAAGLQHDVTNWQPTHGLPYVGRTTDTWKKFGKLGKLASLPINTRDRSYIQTETSLLTAAAAHRNSIKFVNKYAAKFKETKSTTDLIQLMVVIAGVSAGNSERMGSYVNATGDVDFGLNIYLEFRRRIGNELSVHEARVLIRYDNCFFTNCLETWDLAKKLERAGLLDRRTELSCIAAICQRSVAEPKYAPLVPDMLVRAKRLANSLPSQLARESLGQALFAQAFLKSDKAMYLEAAKLWEGIAKEMAGGDAYDRKSSAKVLKENQKLREYIAKKFK